MALLLLVAVPVMAHTPGAGHDAAHDGDNPATTDVVETDFAEEVNHTHTAAPTISSITAVDTKGSPPGTTTPTADTVVSNVNGMKIVLVGGTDLTAAGRLLVAVADADADGNTPHTLDAGIFQLKITFAQDVYPVAAAGEAANAAPTVAQTDVFTGVTIVAAAADAAGVNIGSFFEVGTLTRVETKEADTIANTPAEYSKREFLVPVTISETNARTLTQMRLPVSFWVNVAADQVFSLTALDGPNIVQGRGNAEHTTPNPFMLNGYVAPDPPGPTPRETDAPTVTIAKPATVTAPGSTANLNFVLTFNEAITGLAASDLTIDGGTFVSATANDANTVWTVAVDPTGDPANTEVTVTLNDNSVSDESGNRYMQPTAGPDSARYDTVNPTIHPTATGTITGGAGTLSITFSEALGSGAGGFMNADIDRVNSTVLLTNTEPTMAATQPTDGTQVWELMVTNVTGSQAIVVIQAGSVMDAAGNPLLADTIVTWTRTPDPDPESDVPVVTVALAGGMTYIDSVSGGNVMITATDNVAVTNAVMDAEITVTGGSKGMISNDMIMVTPNVGATTVTVAVAAGAAMDAAGNGSAAVSMEFNVGPIFTIPANTILVVTKTAGMTHNYVSDQPRLPINQNPPTPAPDIETAVWSNMPDLEVLFSFDRGGNGGTLNLTEAAGQEELGQSRDGGNGQHQSVRISEVMWASDLSMRGAQNDAEAAEQWIEITNNTGAEVSIFLFARTGRDSAINVDDVEDRVGNAYDGSPGSAGWTVPGQNGNSYTGVDFVSMHRRWDGAHSRGYVNGTSKGHWSASDQVYLTLATGNPNDGNLYNYKGSPGRPHSIGLPKPSTRAGVTQVPSSPVIINEVANRSDSVRQYEWIELRNVTDSEVNLRNWMISMAFKDGNTPVDRPLVQFPNNDRAKIAPQGVILLLASDPRHDDEHPIAVGYNVDGGPPSDQVDGLGLIVEGSNRQPPRQKVINFENGGMPDGGDFILILRRHDNYEGHRANQDGGKGVAETSIFGQNPRDIDKIIDIAGSHRSLDATNYPGTAPADLNKTTLWPLVNFNNDMRPHYGHGDLNHRRHNRLEVNRVRYRQHVKTTAKNDHDGGTPGNRAGTGVTHKNEDVGHYAFRDAYYTGLGYKRTARITGAHNGTPGYNGNAVGNTGVVKGNATSATVTISEIMASTGRDADNPVLPQWIELYNSSPTDAVNLRNWKLRFEMLNADGSPMDSLMTLDLNKGRVKTIAPQQTVLIVAGNARQANSDAAAGTDVFNENRVFNVFRDYGGANKFGANTRYMFFNPKAFHMALLDKDNKVVDAVGNLDGDARTSDTNTWDYPEGIAEDGNRTSFIRVYDAGKARMAVNTDASNVMPVFGTGDGKKTDNDGIDAKWAWIPAVNTERQFKITIRSTWYGVEDDYGTPNNRPGMVLPVELSFFRPTLEDGVVTVRWTTESELDNAGFNILRSETRDGEYTQVNAEMIQGAGTTGERSTYKWVDPTAKPGVVYYYQIEDVSFAGERQALAITKLKGLISAENKLTTTWSELKASQ